MLTQKREFRSSTFQKRLKFKVGDRIETFNHCRGTVVRPDRDENGDFVVARLDLVPHEFAYDPDDLRVI